MAKKGGIVKKESLKKTYTYEADGLTLSFTLVVDTSSHLRTFKALMERAIADLDEDISKMKN